jgi:two-component system, chemotaxis family, chemotaxis protein CheY
LAKILIVDDSETYRTQLGDDLRKKGHTIVTAVDGEDGLEKLGLNKDVEVIISDVNMPVMDGITMVHKIRTDTAFANIKVFMLTTEATPDMKEKGKKAGVNAWVVKPYVLEKLDAAINKVLQK